MYSGSRSRNPAFGKTSPTQCPACPIRCLSGTGFAARTIRLVALCYITPMVRTCKDDNMLFLQLSFRAQISQLSVKYPLAVHYTIQNIFPRSTSPTPPVRIKIPLYGKPRPQTSSHQPNKMTEIHTNPRAPMNITGTQEEIKKKLLLSFCSIIDTFVERLIGP